MNIRDAEPDDYKIKTTPQLSAAEQFLDFTTASEPITLAMAGSCEYCGLHSWIEMCPKMRCDCGSTVTITAIDKLDGKCVRRCFRCNAVAVWEKP